MMPFKLSKYNVLFEHNSKEFIWNTFSGAVILLDTDALHYYQSFSGYDDNSEYFRILYQNGCIVNSNFDELGKILYDEKAIMLDKNPSCIYFTIAPGLGCNYNCSYCFENQRTSFHGMTEETQAQVFEYLCNRITENKYLRRISITWFGGEPLLYMDTIYSLSKKLISFCEKCHVQYYAGMISNGRLLTKENVGLLKECKIGHLQISVDGMEKYYCQQKEASPQDFQETINNIVYASEHLRTAVRINVTEGSMEEAYQLTDFLLGKLELNNKIKVYIAHTREYTRHLCAAKEQASHGEFLDQEGEYIRLFKKGGKYSLESFEFRAPKRRGTTCLSVCSSNACIGPDGEIYQCEHHFGIKDAVIGSVQHGFYYQQNKSKYLTFHHYPKCEICKFFPVCLGGCLDDKVNSRDMINCDKYRERLIELRMLQFENI